MSTTNDTDLSVLSHARYGKDKVRVFRIVRESEKWHNIVEYNVTALVEGDIETSYTHADNSVVVATDSIKNITYYLAKVSPHILNPERFALHIGTFLVSKYAHLHKAFITVEQLRWSRIPVDKEGKVEQHGWGFWRDGEEKRVVDVEVDASAGKDKITAKVTAGISDLLVLKSTGSAFTSFVRDTYTTLPEVTDRIFSTSIDLSYTFAPIPISVKTVKAVGGEGEIFDFTVPEGDGNGANELGSVWDAKVPARARKVTIEVFAEDESASVQATLYKMAQLIIAQNSSIASVTYKLPNKHYFAVDMGYLGVDNLSVGNAEVFMPVAAPSGLITATITRK